MNKNLFFVVSFFLAVIALLLLGNIVAIGSKIGQITHVYVEYAFYVACLLIVHIYLIRPIVKTRRAPELPVLSINRAHNARLLCKFGRELASNYDYFEDGYIKISNERRKAFLTTIQRNSADADQLRNIISNEINLRINGNPSIGVKGINTRIKEWGKKVAMVTALSQNGKFDTVAVMVMNCRMIADIIRASGFRPTKPQMFKIYLKVLSTALVTYCTSAVFSDMGEGSLTDLGNGGEMETDIPDVTETDVDISDLDMDENSFEDILSTIFKKLPVPIVGSFAQGAINGLLTLRIGYVTKAYLTEGPNALTGIANKRRIKRQAMQEALSTIHIPKVVAGAAGNVTTMGLKGLNYIFK